jgi:hypothetical protein
MSSIYVVREYVEAHNQVLDSIENATQALRSFERGTDDVVEATEEIKEVADKLQKSVENVSRETGILANKIDFAKKRFSEIGEVALYGAKRIMEYNDAARMSIRGTSLMSASTEEMRRSVNGLTTLGPKVAEAMSYSSKEASQFSANLIADMERVSGSLDIAEASKQVQEYAKNVRGSATLLNMSSSDMMGIQHQMVGQARMSLSDLQQLMTESASYATTLGLEGKDVQAMTARHMETVMALDKDSRKAYISDLAYAAGVQKKAATDFGKYATSLTQKEGTEALQSEILLSSFSGMNLGEVSSTIARAEIDPQKMMELYERSFKGMGLDLEEYRTLFEKRLSGKGFSEDEAAKFRLMETSSETLTKAGAPTLAQMLNLTNSLKEINIPTKEEAKAAVPELTGEDNQKAIQDRLITYDETVARFTAKADDLIIAAADASGALGRVADSMRDMAAAGKVASDATPSIFKGLSEFMSSTLSVVLGSAITRLAGGRLLGGGGGKGVGKVAGREAAEVAVESGVKVAGREAAEVAVESGVKVAGREAAEVAVESGVKVAGREAAEAVGKKALGKTLLKKIPGIGLLMGAGFAIDKMLEGDFTGAGLELASGAASTVPGIGTAASFAIDAASAARDINKAMNEPKVLGEESSETQEFKLAEMKKDQAPVNEVENKTQNQNAILASSLEQALGGMKMTGVEKHLVGNRKVLEELIPILSEMRDSIISRPSSLISAI